MATGRWRATRRRGWPAARLQVLGFYAPCEGKTGTLPLRAPGQAAAETRVARDTTHPRMVRHRILLGERKW